MKIFKNILCITAFFTVGSSLARPMDKKTTTTPAPTAKKVATPTPAKGKVTITPATQNLTLKQWRDKIVSSKISSDWFNTTNRTFDPKFKKHLEEMTANKQVGYEQALCILTIIRDKFTPFTGDDEQDLELLQYIDGQITEILSDIL